MTLPEQTDLCYRCWLAPQRSAYPVQPQLSLVRMRPALAATLGRSGLRVYLHTCLPPCKWQMWLRADTALALACTCTPIHYLFGCHLMPPLLLIAADLPAGHLPACGSQNRKRGFQPDLHLHTRMGLDLEVVLELHYIRRCDGPSGQAHVSYFVQRLCR